MQHIVMTNIRDLGFMCRPNDYFKTAHKAVMEGGVDYEACPLYVIEDDLLLTPLCATNWTWASNVVDWAYH